MNELLFVVDVAGGPFAGAVFADVDVAAVDGLGADLAAAAYA